MCKWLRLRVKYVASAGCTGFMELDSCKNCNNNSVLFDIRLFLFQNQKYYFLSGI